MKAKILACVLVMSSAAFCDVELYPATVKLQVLKPEQSSWHAVSPFCHFKGAREGDLKMSSTMVGVGYNYLQTQGYNLKMQLSLSDLQSPAQCGQLVIENKYMFKPCASTSLYPYLGLATDAYILRDSWDMAKQSVMRTQWHMGMGTAKQITPYANVGLRAGIYMDSYKRSEVSFGNGTSLMEDMTKDQGYLLGLNFDVNITDSFLISMQPSFSKSFSRDNSERNLRTTFSYVF